MHVSDVIDDIKAAFEQFPDAARWRVGVATYVDGPGSDISVMYAASYHVDGDGFFLVPEGMGEAFALEERPFTARELLDALEAEARWAGYAVHVRAEIVELADSSFASRNLPLWGAGVHDEAELVYFYYGAMALEA
ncbi:hypothetical protein GCM10007067_00790 [Lysobacter bugurensis]|uniref:Uncharacterized protein n=2 Tax=Cognatilysobacter bugurensis TaxID=543356 RepID=A0A918SSM4_9GAMM|nr:hypothetical protein GCM10007067_00790 [Lysobacter bugurensis]